MPETASAPLEASAYSSPTVPCVVGPSKRAICRSSGEKTGSGESANRVGITRTLSVPETALAEASDPARAVHPDR